VFVEFLCQLRFLLRNDDHLKIQTKKKIRKKYNGITVYSTILPVFAVLSINGKILWDRFSQSC